jgi:hypothetical protein
MITNLCNLQIIGRPEPSVDQILSFLDMFLISLCRPCLRVQDNRMLQICNHFARSFMTFQYSGK